MWRIVVVRTLAKWSREFISLEGKQTLIDPMGSKVTKISFPVRFLRPSVLFCIALIRTYTMLFEEPSGRLKSLKRVRFRSSYHVPALMSRFTKVLHPFR